MAQDYAKTPSPANYKAVGAAVSYGLTALLCMALAVVIAIAQKD